MKKYAFYFWHVLESGYSMGSSSRFIGTIIVFFTLSSIALISWKIIGLVFSFDSTRIIQEKSEFILIPAALLGYYIIHRIRLEYESRKVAKKIHAFPVKLKDWLNVIMLATGAILFFVLAFAVTFW